MNTNVGIGSGTMNGTIGEMVASITKGVKGRSRKGKTATGSFGDLADSTEVKAMKSSDGSVDCVAKGTLHLIGSKYVVHFEDAQLPFLKYDGVRELLSRGGALTPCFTSVLRRTRSTGLELKIASETTIPIRQRSTRDLCTLLDDKQLRTLSEERGLPTLGGAEQLIDNLAAAQNLPFAGAEGWSILINSSDFDTQIAQEIMATSHRSGPWHIRSAGTHLNFGKKASKK